MTDPIHDVPTTVITGFLGAGKTTVLRHLLNSRPTGARWAVFVNEFGEIGVDAAALGGERSVEGLAIKELAGGCICCANGLPFVAALNLLLREVRPSRLLIEPTGLAELSNLLGTLRGPNFRKALSLRATVTVVDPSRLDDPYVADSPVFQSQIEGADVLVATRADRADEKIRRRWDAFVAGLDPAPPEVIWIAKGALDPAWLDRPAAKRSTPAADHHHHSRAPMILPEGDIARTPYSDKQVAACGWRFPKDWRFSTEALDTTLCALMADTAVLPAGLIRLKGAVIGEDGCWLFNGEGDVLAWEPLPTRTDSRFELIVPAAPPPDWAAVEAHLKRCALGSRA